MTQDRPAAAEDSTRTVLSKADQLKSFLENGRIEPKTNRPRIRELIYSNYRIIYLIEEKQLSILTVRHGKQILPADEIQT